MRFARERNAASARNVREGEAAGDEALVREVNLLDRYSMGLHDFANKARIGRNTMTKLVHHLRFKKPSSVLDNFAISLCDTNVIAQMHY